MASSRKSRMPPPVYIVARRASSALACPPAGGASGRQRDDQVRDVAGAEVHVGERAESAVAFSRKAVDARVVAVGRRIAERADDCRLDAQVEGEGSGIGVRV